MHDTLLEIKLRNTELREYLQTSVNFKAVYFTGIMLHD